MGAQQGQRGSGRQGEASSFGRSPWLDDDDYDQHDHYHYHHYYYEHDDGHPGDDDDILNQAC